MDFFIFNVLLFFLVLDPRLKLNYYKDNEWEEPYITEIQNSISDLYQKQYAPLPSTVIESDQNKVRNDNLLNHIYKKRHPSNENQLDSYLNSSTMSPEINLLEWWKV